MLIIGITGGTGSGKTTALEALDELGALVLDCDAVYHELLDQNPEIKSEIEARFGNVSTDGMIDRKKLGDIVFNDPSALTDLNKITHKYISDEIDKRIKTRKEQGGKLAAVDAIALIESGQNKNCDIVIGIIAPAEIRVERIINRDGITCEQAEARIAAQQTDEFYREHCDYILVNNFNTPAEFIKKCKSYFTGLIGGNGNANKR